MNQVRLSRMSHRETSNGQTQVGESWGTVLEPSIFYCSCDQIPTEFALDIRFTALFICPIQGEFEGASE